MPTMVARVVPNPRCVPTMVANSEGLRLIDTSIVSTRWHTSARGLSGPASRFGPAGPFSLPVIRLRLRISAGSGHSPMIIYDTRSCCGYGVLCHSAGSVFHKSLPQACMATAISLVCSQILPNAGTIVSSIIRHPAPILSPLTFVLGFLLGTLPSANPHLHVSLTQHTFPSSF